MHHTSRRSDLLANPLFWAAYYHELLSATDVDSAEFLEPYFGVSVEAVDQFFVDELCRSAHTRSAAPDSSWVSITMPLPEKFDLHLVFADAANYEQRYLLTHPAWSAPELLGYACGEFALPALRWHEIVQVALCCLDSTTSVRPSPLALVLLFPAMWLAPSDDRSQIHALLVTAWQKLGIIRPSMVQAFVSQIISYQISTLEWWHDQRMGWINNGEYSLRNPNTLMRQFAVVHFARISQFTDLLDQYAAKRNEQTTP